MDDPAKDAHEAYVTRGSYARFSVLENIYKKHLQWALDDVGDDMQVEYRRHCVLRCYLLFLVDMLMFVNKIATYVDVVYLKYFIGLNAIHEYNWGAACLVYLYSKMGENCLWKTK